MATKSEKKLIPQVTYEIVFKYKCVYRLCLYRSRVGEVERGFVCKDRDVYKDLETRK